MRSRTSVSKTSPWRASSMARKRSASRRHRSASRHRRRGSRSAPTPTTALVFLHRRGSARWGRTARSPRRAWGAALAPAPRCPPCEGGSAGAGPRTAVAATSSAARPARARSPPSRRHMMGHRLRSALGPGAGIGRQCGLKSRCSHERGGSSPSPGICRCVMVGALKRPREGATGPDRRSRPRSHLDLDLSPTQSPMRLQVGSEHSRVPERDASVGPPAECRGTPGGSFPSQPNTTAKSSVDPSLARA